MAEAGSFGHGTGWSVFLLEFHRRGFLSAPVGNVIEGNLPASGNDELVFDLSEAGNPQQLDFGLVFLVIGLSGVGVAAVLR